MINVSTEHLSIILPVLKKYVPGCEVRVFGSRFKGITKDYSDLDLVIVGKNKIDRKTIADMKEEFVESDLPYRVDLLDWNAITPEFRRVIREHGSEVIQNAAKLSRE